MILSLRALMPNATNLGDDQMITLKLTKATVADLTKPSEDVGVVRFLMDHDMAIALRDNHRAPNRPLTNGTVEAYARDMIAGRWNGLNGEPLKFDTDGLLMDGDHRVNAVCVATQENAKPDLTVEFIAFVGIRKEARATMDDGRKRSAADELNMTVVKDAKIGTRVVQALRALAVLTGGQTAGRRMTKAVLLETLRHHPKLVDSVKLVFADPAKLPKLRPAVVAAMHYLAAHVVPDAADKAATMLSVWQTGIPTPGYAKDPMHALFMYVVNRQLTLTEFDSAKAMSKAWDLYASNAEAPARIEWRAALIDIAGAEAAVVFKDMPEMLLDLRVNVRPDTTAGKVEAEVKADTKGKKAAAKAPAKAGTKEAKKAAAAIKDATSKEQSQPKVDPAGLLPDGTPNLDLIPDDLSEQLKANQKRAGADAAKFAKLAAGKGKGGQTAAPATAPAPEGQTPATA